MLTNDYRVDALLSGIQIVELYESIAVRALHALRCRRVRSRTIDHVRSIP